MVAPEEGVTLWRLIQYDTIEKQKYRFYGQGKDFAAGSGE
jgi:hypothetical protein